MRVAEPEMEAALLELAREATAAQLERLLRGYRRALEPDAASSAMERRHLATRWEEDGSLSIRGSLPADEGALFLKALEIARDALSHDSCDVAAEPGEQAATMPDRADALVAVSESAIARGVTAAAGGDRHQVVVHVDVGELLGRGRDGSASLEEGVPLPAATAKRLACDASIVTLVERDGEPLSVGRKTRSIPPSLQRALRSRDRGCRFPGCGRDRFVDAHHVEHWAEGGETSLANLVQLCRHHHRLVHEGGITIANRPGGLEFRTPNGRVLETSPQLPCAHPAECLAAGGSPPLDENVASPRSWGESIDYDLAVFVLAELQERRTEAAERKPHPATAVA